MTMGPITAIQVGFACATAGLKVGDTIVAVDGHSLNGADKEQSRMTSRQLPSAVREGCSPGKDGPNSPFFDTQ